MSVELYHLIFLFFGIIVVIFLICVPSMKLDDQQLPRPRWMTEKVEMDCIIGVMEALKKKDCLNEEGIGFLEFMKKERSK